MAYRKYKLGDLVEQYDEINQNGEFTEIEDLQGKIGRASCRERV